MIDSNPAPNIDDGDDREWLEREYIKKLDELARMRRDLETLRDDLDRRVRFAAQFGSTNPLDRTIRTRITAILDGVKK